MDDLETLASVPLAGRPVEDLAPLLSSTLDHVCEVVHLLDHDGRIVYVNAEGCKRLGYRRDELLVMTVFDIDPELTCARWRHYLETCNDTRFRRFERTHRCKDGSTYPVDVVAGPVAYRGGAYRLALSRDIGERRRAEQREQARLQLYERLAGGGSLDEVLALVALYVRRGVHGGCDVRVALLEPGGELLVAAAAGAPAVPVSWAEPICGSTGAALGVITVYRHDGGEPTDNELELTRSACQLASIAIERTRLEAARRESERQFRTLAENLPDMVVRYDSECRRTYVNPAFERATGVRASDAIGTPIGTLWPSGTSEPYRSELLRVAQHGGSAEWVCSHPARDGSGRVHLAVRAVAEYGADGKPIGVLSIGHDITAQKEAERRLRASHDELRELAARSERAREEERRRIAHEIHDELGQLLTALRMSISTLGLRLGAQGPAIDDHVVSMLGLTDRTLQVVRDIVSTLRPAALDLGIVSALEWLVAEFRRHTGVACRLHAPATPVEIDDACATAAFRIVQESLTNVARHAGARAVEIRIECDGGHYRIEVRDDGCGFDVASASPHSFGLIGMRERALMVGGEMTIDSTPARGTALRLRVPAIPRSRRELP